MTSDRSGAYAASTSGRLRPAMSRDTAFFWEGAREHRLLVQRCRSCGEPRHPPGPMCPRCRSLEWEAHEVSGRGTLFTFMVHHHPKVSGFDGPVVVGVVELDEGTRLLANVVGVDPADLRIGERLETFFVDQDEGWTVPQFRRPAP